MHMCVAMEINSRAMPMPDECFTSPWFFMLFIIAIYVLLCMCQCGFHSIHVEVRGEAVGVGSLPTRVSSRSSAVIGQLMADLTPGLLSLSPVIFPWP